MQKTNFESMMEINQFKDISVDISLPEKESSREAIEHLLARKREIRPLFVVPARPIPTKKRNSDHFWIQFSCGIKDQYTRNLPMNVEW